MTISVPHMADVTPEFAAGVLDSMLGGVDAEFLEDMLSLLEFELLANLHVALTRRRRRAAPRRRSRSPRRDPAVQQPVPVPNPIPVPDIEPDSPEFSYNPIGLPMTGSPKGRGKK